MQTAQLLEQLYNGKTLNKEESAVIFNALIIVALIPLALRGIPYKALRSDVILKRNIFVYGLGGLVFPFVGIKAIDMLLTLFGLA